MAFLRAFNSAGVVAVFDEPNTNGDPLDFNAPRNAPAKTPASNLSAIHFHSDFDYYELVSGPTTVVVSHPSLAGFTSADLGVLDVSVYSYGQTAETDFVLVTHDLGYKPRFFVAYNGAMLTNGTVVQTEGADGRGRFVSAYATTTQIILRDFTYSTALAVSAVSRSYEIMVFKEPAQNLAQPLMGFDGTVLSLGRDRIRSDKKYLRKVLAAESSFDIDLGVTVDVNGGRIRIVSGGNIYTETGYLGYFTGPAYVPVGGIS